MEHSEVTLPTATSCIPSPHPIDTARTSHSLHSVSSHNRTATNRARTRLNWYTTRSSTDWPLSVGDTENIVFAGQPVLASPSFGCVLVDCVGVEKAKDLPEQLKVCMLNRNTSNGHSLVISNFPCAVHPTPYTTADTQCTNGGRSAAAVCRVLRVS